MTQRQILRQLAEAGRLRLQDFDDAALAHLLRDELVTGQTVRLRAHSADQHLLGSFVIWRLEPHDGRCTECECTTFGENPTQLVNSR